MKSVREMYKAKLIDRVKSPDVNSPAELYRWANTIGLMADALEAEDDRRRNGKALMDHMCLPSVVSQALQKKHVTRLEDFETITIAEFKNLASNSNGDPAEISRVIEHVHRSGFLFACELAGK